MANTNAPFGFADSHRLGAAVNYQMAKRWISASNPTPIYTGDPIIQLSTGYIAQASAPPLTTNVGGIFAGCAYMSVSQKRRVHSPWWPGSDAVVSGSGFDVEAYVIDDPLTVFRVQANGLATLAMVGMNAQYVLGAGNQVTGKSGAAIDVVTNVPAVTATWPFRILDLVRDPSGAPGADPTTAYNWLYVTFNNQDFKSLTGI